MPKKNISTRRHSKWRNRLAIDIYELACQGMTDRAMSQFLGISPALFLLWKRNKRLVQYALKKAQRYRAQLTDKSFGQFVESRLNKEQRLVWDKINEVEHEKNGLARLDALFARHGMRMRQHLFCHALVKGLFNVGVACKKLGIARSTVDKWMDSDPEFASMIDVIHKCKQEYFQTALHDKIRQGDTNAIIFANKTQNRTPGFLHEGYGDKVDVQVNGEVRHKHVHKHQISLADLDLPLEIKKRILDAIDAKEISSEPVEQKLLSNGSAQHISTKQISTSKKEK